MNLIRQAFTRIDETAQEAEKYLEQYKPAEEEQKQLSRLPAKLQRVERVEVAHAPLMTIEQARAEMQAAIDAYLLNPDPDYVLLIAAPAGIGKTTMLIGAAEKAAMLFNRRVLFAGQRRDMWADVLATFARDPNRNPSLWYEWQPRDENTCLYPREIAEWQKRGHSSLSFCSNKSICGWNHMSKHCAYYAQKRRKEPIVFVQHQHVSIAHPLMDQTAVLIGDENPLSAFLHPWHIPHSKRKNYIVPFEYEHEETDLAHMLKSLRILCQVASKESVYFGPELLKYLGGAERVHRICNDASISIDDELPLESAQDANEASYNYVPYLVSLLYKEAVEALAGNDYIPRVFVGCDGIKLYLRHWAERLPKHIIWLDATADERLYEILLGRKVKVVRPNVAMRGRVFQIYNSRNNKHALDSNEEKRATLKAQVDEIASRYQNPAIISYKSVIDELAGDRLKGHFGGNRGTNRFQECDCLIVVGTPQPDMSAIKSMAAMLFADRMAAFDLTWSTQLVPFFQQSLAYEVANYWNDPDLRLLVEQLREAEMIQALNRARPLIRDVDIYILSNVPLHGVPVTLMSANELRGIPNGVKADLWEQVQAWAVALEQQQGYVTTADLVKQFGISKHTADSYIDKLAEIHGWEVFKAIGRGRGRPPKAARSA